MAKVIRLAEYRARPSLVHFNRIELTLLMNLYSRRVAAGEWRDYAIDQGTAGAMFSIYRHAGEHPLYTVAKQASRTHPTVFVVATPERELARSPSLSEALKALERAPRLVQT